MDVYWMNTTCEISMKELRPKILEYLRSAGQVGEIENVAIVCPNCKHHQNSNQLTDDLQSDFRLIVTLKETTSKRRWWRQ
jgi:hypothetical protein